MIPPNRLKTRDETSSRLWRTKCFSSPQGLASWSRTRQKISPFAVASPKISRRITRRRSAMTPNQVTLTRVAAAFAAVALFTLFGNALAADLTAVALTVAAIALDGVDGYLARTRGLATPLGAQLDILGDRIVENLFFTFFAVSGSISLWVPVLFFVRGTATDFLRALAARNGRSGFGRNSMLESWWGRTLVASRASRAAYAILKCVCFCYLGLLLPAAHVNAPWLNPGIRHTLALAGQFLVAATVAFCTLRAVPVVWDGRRYLAAAEQKTPAPVAVQATR
jgi:CDP-diacylglycerol--glycerol-3-phosphate 3-phosphatidyltransferase